MPNMIEGVDLTKGRFDERYGELAARPTDVPRGGRYGLVTSSGYQSESVGCWDIIGSGQKSKHKTA